MSVVIRKCKPVSLRLSVPSIRLRPAIIIILCSLFSGHLIGCSKLVNLSRTSKRYSNPPVFSPYPVHDYPNYSVGRFKIPFLAEQITRVLKVGSGKTVPLVVLPIQELDETNKLTVSSFGRYFSEQLKTELYLNDFRILYPGQIVEDQLVTLISGNYFTLPRHEPLIGQLLSDGVNYLICGSYQVGVDKIYVNLQVLALDNTEIISIGTCELDKEKEIMYLVEKRKRVKGIRDVAETDKDNDEADQESSDFTVRSSFSIPVDPEK